MKRLSLTDDEITLIANMLQSGTFQGAIARVVADLQDKIRKAQGEKDAGNGKAH